MKKALTLLVLTALLFTACNKEETDQEKPVIDLSADGAFPQNCDTLWLGETFTFRAVFTDNQALGSFIIEIHEDFDHHEHSTETEICEPMPEREPENPFMYLQNFTLAEGLNHYQAVVDITIPEGNTQGPYDEGDYHFFISLTDREGWSEQKGLSVKIMSR